MDIISFLSKLDTQLFLFLNGIHNSFFDGLMYGISNIPVWIPFYLSTIYIAVRYYKKEVLFVIPVLVLCVILTDQISSGLIKDWVQRPRPSREESLAPFIHLVNGYQGGRFGFVSSHAANTFGFALLTSVLFRNRWYASTIILWSLIVSYSRIYLGVHYPLDILGGMLVGAFAAYICFTILKKIKPRLVSSDSYLISAFIPNVVILLTFLGIGIFAIIRM
ncbi:MAG: phosphatase PAP2 family protein [Paludibacteraceae bacterium]|nr:phosphatase PAP2 family protein [Paludibacteraceae bacterium]